MCDCRSRYLNRAAPRSVKQYRGVFIPSSLRTPSTAVSSSPPSTLPSARRVDEHLLVASSVCDARLRRYFQILKPVVFVVSLQSWLRHHPRPSRLRLATLTPAEATIQLGQRTLVLMAVPIMTLERLAAAATIFKSPKARLSPSSSSWSLLHFSAVRHFPLPYSLRVLTMCSRFWNTILSCKEERMEGPRDHSQVGQEGRHSTDTTTLRVPEVCEATVDEVKGRTCPS